MSRLAVPQHALSLRLEQRLRQLRVAAARRQLRRRAAPATREQRLQQPRTLRPLAACAAALCAAGGLEQQPHGRGVALCGREPGRRAWASRRETVNRQQIKLMGGGLTRGITVSIKIYPRTFLSTRVHPGTASRANWYSERYPTNP